MTKWNAENTEGFTADELATLNAAQEELEAYAPGVDPGNITDALNNEFRDGITAAELVSAVKAVM